MINSGREWDWMDDKTKTKMSKVKKLGITKFPYSEYNDKGDETYYENSDGWWEKYEYNEKGFETYYEDSSGYWRKREYNEQGDETYYENSDGEIRNNKPKINNYDK